MFFGTDKEIDVVGVTSINGGGALRHFQFGRLREDNGVSHRCLFSVALAETVEIAW